MRNTLLDPFEDLPRAVVVTSNDYAAGLCFARHSHRRGQFAFAACGSITVTTPQGSWLVPPQRACWVPAGMAHEMTMGGRVTMLNCFVSVKAAQTLQLPTRCCVQAVSPLLRHLLEDAVDLPACYDEQGRDGKLMALLLAEIAAMPQLSLHAPLPVDARLAKACTRLFAQPTIAVDIDSMAQQLGMSRRSFTRFFRAQTGMGFAQWRLQVCLMAAIARLGQGEAVTSVALDLGYSSTSAFSAAFCGVLGVAPSQYLDVEARSG
jgi:AraC-like DNA-binding protein